MELWNGRLTAPSGVWGGEIRQTASAIMCVGGSYEDSMAKIPRIEKLLQL